MLWNERNQVDEHLRFEVRTLDCEKVAPLCREFGV